MSTHRRRTLGVINFNRKGRADDGKANKARRYSLAPSRKSMDGKGVRFSMGKSKKARQSMGFARSGRPSMGGRQSMGHRRSRYHLLALLHSARTLLAEAPISCQPRAD